MKVASWNVNSVRARLDRVIAWLDQGQPDVLCLQETKVRDEQFPAEALAEAGYTSLYYGQKTYNGVAILTRAPTTEEARGLGDGEDELGARFLVAEVQGVWVASVYVPNGREVGSAHFEQKLRWIGRVRAFLQAHCSPEDPVLLCGDWNVTPDSRDVWDPEGLDGTLLCHPAEREALSGLLRWGLTDTFRQHHEEGGRFSWWDYRQLAFPRNHGLRIDLILATAALASQCRLADIDREARKGRGASDHAPVIAEFSGV